MSEKDNKTAMQILLVASGWALVLLYLFFTKETCWEMSKCMKCTLIAAACVPLLCVVFFIGKIIWCGDNKEQYILCCKNKIVQECDIDLMAELIYAQKDDEITDVYIINPNKPYDFYEKFILLKDKNIHLCKDYSIFKIKLKDCKNNNEQK